MCNDQTEDWRQLLKCPLIYSALHRADSWAQLRKTLKRWKIPNDFLTAVDKGMQSYVTAPKKAKDRTIPTTPFSATWNRERNALKSAYYAPSKIAWENMVKSRTAQEWIQFMETHYANQGYTLKAQTGHHHLLVLYGKIDKECGNLGTQFIMLIKMDE
jgi:hypothetical protein